MKRYQLYMVVALALAILGGGVVAYAQITEAAFARVPFQFVVGDQTYEPGAYSVRISEGEQIELMPEHGRAGFALAITRLAEPEKGVTEPQLVFDKIENRYILSEVWLPGEDGFLISEARQKHTHVRVKVQKSR